MSGRPRPPLFRSTFFGENSATAAGRKVALRGLKCLYRWCPGFLRSAEVKSDFWGQLLTVKPRLRVLFLVRHPAECFASTLKWFDQAVDFDLCTRHAIRGAQEDEFATRCLAYFRACTFLPVLQETARLARHMAVVHLDSFLDADLARKTYERIAEFLGASPFPADYVPFRSDWADQDPRMYVPAREILCDPSNINATGALVAAMREDYLAITEYITRIPISDPTVMERVDIVC